MSRPTLVGARPLGERSTSPPSHPPRPGERILERRGSDPALEGLRLLESGPNALELVVEMAHDLRSPVASILVLAEALQSGEAGPVNEMQQRQLGLMRSAAYCLCAVASDVLSLAKGNGSLIEPRPVAFSVRDVMVTVRDMVAPLLEYKGIELRTDTPATDIRMGHPRALTRVLLNLTTNALKVTDRGWVRISAEPRDGETGGGLIEFAVEDTGPGLDIPAEQLFQPFRRAVADRRAGFSSSGLGLSICHNLVRLMGGAIEVQSRLGAGARFAFRLDVPGAPPK